MHFALREGPEDRNIRVGLHGQITTKTDAENNRYLQYYEDVLKSNHGGIQHRKMEPQITRGYENKVNPESCPVKIYQKYMNLVLFGTAILLSVFMFYKQTRGKNSVQWPNLRDISQITPSVQQEGRKEGNVLFNDALNTFYLRLYGIGHMVKDHSDSERGNPLPPHGLLFPINSKGSFICTIPQTG